MAIPKKIAKKIMLDLRGMSAEQKNILKNKVGKYLVGQITDDCSVTRSPVTGRNFKKLSSEYSSEKRKRGQPPVPNLQLSDRMLKALRFKTTREGVEVGIYASNQVKKADNHCKFSTESIGTGVPKRTFIPKEEENFRPEIRNEIRKINREFRSELGLRIKKD